jgi:hypothetical protein
MPTIQHSRVVWLEHTGVTFKSEYTHIQFNLRICGSVLMSSSLKSVTLPNTIEKVITRINIKTKKIRGF